MIILIILQIADCEMSTIPLSFRVEVTGNIFMATQQSILKKNILEILGLIKREISLQFKTFLKSNLIANIHIGYKNMNINTYLVLP